MNWQEMLKDKRFLAAAAVVAVVGVVMLMRSKGTASGDPESENATGNPQGTFDTSGTDMASWFSQYNSSVLDALREIAAQQKAGGSTSPAPGNVNNPRPPVPRVPNEPVPSRLIPRDTRLPYSYAGEPVPNSVVPRLGY